MIWNQTDEAEKTAEKDMEESIEEAVRKSAKELSFRYTIPKADPGMAAEPGPGAFWKNYSGKDHRKK